MVKAHLDRIYDKWPGFPFRMPLVGSKLIKNGVYEVINELDLDMEYKWLRDTKYSDWIQILDKDAHGKGILDISAGHDGISKIEIRTKVV